MNLTLRTMLLSDVDAVAAAEKLIFSDPWSEGAIKDVLLSEGRMCYVAEMGKETVAYLVGRVIPPEGEIYRVATLPEHRRGGIARRLVAFAIGTQAQKQNGLSTVFLEVRKGNAPARSLYASCGFFEVGVRNNYYKDPPDDAVIMMYTND